MHLAFFELLGFPTLDDLEVPSHGEHVADGLCELAGVERAVRMQVEGHVGGERQKVKKLVASQTHLAALIFVDHVLEELCEALVIAY